MSRITYALPVLLMFFLGALTLWLRQVIETPGETRTAKQRHDPDAIVERFLVTRLGADGKPETRLSARRMVHFADNSATELDAPQLVRSRGGSTVRVRAERGSVNSDYSEAKFVDKVELVRAEDGSQDQLQVRTEYLLVRVQEEELRTDRPVTISHGGSTISGVGMEYKRKDGKIELLSDVKASFPPKSARGPS